MIETSLELDEMPSNYEQTLISEGYEERPYGWRKSLSGTSQLIVIEPGKHTGINVASLNTQGLRGHPGEIWERAMHLGCLDGTDGNESLLYKVLDGKDVQERSYRRGQSFFSVSPDGSGENKPGYWHIMANNSDKPIRLLIRWRK
ncbi:MAG: hypothetical protein HYW23_00855 [Candidatus Aenigmarchaeota archaeon]|nr:hypothetical protein [Candidatus Aenigmarchaeota archaeon]